MLGAMSGDYHRGQLAFGPEPRAGVDYSGEDMDKRVVVCLSSGLSPQYRVSIFSGVWHCPDGMSIQFRYGQSLIGENLREETGRQSACRVSRAAGVR